MKSLNEQIESFYLGLFDIQDDGRYVESWDANTPLKLFLREHLKEKSDAATRRALVKENDKYRVANPQMVNNKKNIYNLFEEPFPVFSAWKENGETLLATLNDTKQPKRETLLRIAFALQMDSNTCDKMLEAAGQYRIHTGGSAQESIYSYCLDDQRSYSEAEELYKEYLGLPESPPSELAERKLSQRTKSNADIIKKFLKEHEAFSRKEKDRAFIRLLHTKSHTFTANSGRAWRLVHTLHKRISTDEFLSFFGESLLYERDYIHQKLRDSLNNRRSIPTRDYICLLSMVVYYKEFSSQTQSMVDFVNTNLASCGLSPLMLKHNPDSLIIELSHYKIANRSKNWISYSNRNMAEQVILSHIDKKSPFEIGKHLIEVYTHGKYSLLQPLRNMCFMKADAFFEREEK